jgi:hypothetical protein
MRVVIMIVYVHGGLHVGQEDVGNFAVKLSVYLPGR